MYEHFKDQIDLLGNQQPDVFYIKRYKPLSKKREKNGNIPMTVHRIRSSEIHKLVNMKYVKSVGLVPEFEVKELYPWGR